MTANDILWKLKGVRKTAPNRWMAQCCAHEDRLPSLSIREEGDRLLLYCFAGCSYESILQALGYDPAFRPTYIPRPARHKVEPPKVDLKQIWNGWYERTDYYDVDGLAMSLGVEAESLKLIGCARADKAWAFPMKDENRELIGIRLRNNEGFKWAVKGSKQGLFISEWGCEPVTFIVEGPTDTAAAMTIGLSAMGRPSCLGCEQMISDYVRGQKVRRVVIITDNDEPGVNGARKLQRFLKVPSCIWIPPAKDLREFVQLGGDEKMIDSAIRNLVWQR